MVARKYTQFIVNFMIFIIGFTFLATGIAQAEIILQGQVLKTNRTNNSFITDEVVIRIYNSPYGGQLLYEETHLLPSSTNDLNLILGNGDIQTTATETDLNPENLWLEIEYANHILSPRLNMATREQSLELSDGFVTITSAGLRNSGTGTIIIDENGISIAGLLNMGSQAICLGGVNRNSWPNEDGTSWNDLNDIPACFADNVDDTGINEESDPTVLDSVKDGVSWSELSNIPHGFADGIDNDSGGTITGITPGTGLTGGGTTGNISLSLTNPLSLSGSSNCGIISAENNFATNGSGVYGKTTGVSGYGIYGEATDTGNSSVNFGGYFTAAGYYGIGAHGSATGTEGIGVEGSASGDIGVGVLGETTADTGKGVYGWAKNTGSGPSYGGYFYNSGSDGIGIYAKAGNNGGTTNFGGYFEALGSSGKAVFGKVSGISAIAIEGQTSGGTGIGVKGTASATSNTANYGGYFTAAGDNSRGVYGCTTSNADTAVGVYGQGPSYGVYGRADGTEGRGITGWASATGDTENYGGKFKADGIHGYGVKGESTGNLGYGVYGKAPFRGLYGNASGVNGIGVTGYASATGDDTENSGGYFEAAGGYATAVCGKATNDSDGGVNFGGDFEAHGMHGTGIRGTTYGHKGSGVVGITTYDGPYIEGEGAKGGSFHAYGQMDCAVYGFAHNTVGYAKNYGGFFVAQGGRGVGVYGQDIHDGGIGVQANGKRYDFYASGLGVNYGSFTGAHDVKLAADTSEVFKIGMVMTMTGEVAHRPEENDTPCISSTLPTVTLCRQANDPKVLGALVDEGDLPHDHWYQAKKGDRFGQVNAVGEGRVWVCDLNGTIQAGDYVTTSPVAGYGQKQDDDIMHSYTLGKVTETPNWESISEIIDFQGQPVKVYLIAIIYTSG